MNKNISIKTVALFWLPLAITWLMMSVEGPFIAAIIARLPNPKFNLAAYGVAFAFALIIEAPIIMMMSASIALVKDWIAYKKLRNFNLVLNIFITLIMLVSLIPSVYYYIMKNLLNLPFEVSGLTYKALIILLPWPAAIGYRRFYQGLLIIHNKTSYVALGTLVRLTGMMATGLVFYNYLDNPGVVAGATALSVGVVAEAIACRLLTNGIVKNYKSGAINNDEVKNNLRYRHITKFYYPLALTSMISLGVYPLITFFIGKCAAPIESLAVLPVINAFVFIFRSIGFSYQETCIAFLGKTGKSIKQLNSFAFILVIVVTVFLITVAFSSLSGYWFVNISGLSLELTSYALIPLQILIFLPALEVLISLQRAVVVHSKKTMPVTIATIIEVAGIILVMIVMMQFTGLSGAIAAALASVIGRIAANLYFYADYQYKNCYKSYFE